MSTRGGTRQRTANQGPIQGAKQASVGLGGPVSGRERGEKTSRSQPTLPLTSVDTSAQTRLTSWLGQAPSAQQLRDMVGAPSDAYVRVAPFDELRAVHGEGVRFTLIGPLVPVTRLMPDATGTWRETQVQQPLFGGDEHGAADRYLYRTSDGSLVMRNQTLRVLPEYQGRGTGVRIFAKQAKTLSSLHGTSGQLRVREIVANLAGHKDSSDQGYRIWPLMGYNTRSGALRSHYDAMLRDKSLARGERDRLKRLGRDLTLLDVYESADGRTWWREHGAAVEGVFDLTPGSRSMQTLRTYLASKGISWESL